MKRIVVLVALLFSGMLSFGQYNFAVSEIPEDLKTGADAVTRFDETEFIIEDIKSSVTKKHWAVTIFNETGESQHSVFRAYYDKFSQVRKIEGTIYDAGGKVLKKLKNSDIRDIGIGSIGDEITDTRVKIAEFDKKYYPYPYTVEFSFDEKSSNMMFFPTWMPASMERNAIQKSSFMISVPDGIKVHKLSQNIPTPSKVTRNGTRTDESWEIADFRTGDFESYSKNLTAPKVITAPVDFQINDYVGKINSWSDISSFYYQLNSGRDKLPESLVSELNNMLKDEKSIEARVRKIYSYVQARSRYQSIQLGIGGWQTIPASVVATKGYGDCKALTNFTLALLKTAGIEAYAALIKAGEDAVWDNPEIPRMNFNHVIACVPVKNDTIWLECTSQDNSFGYQGDFTGNRMALLIKPAGGGLVKTTAYEPEANFLYRTAEVSVSETGNARIKMNTSFGGIQQDTRAYLYKSMNVEEQKDWLMKRIHLPNFKILTVGSSLDKKRNPVLSETLDIEATNLCTFSGKRMFLKLNLFGNFIDPDGATGERKSELYLNPNMYNFLDTDSLVFEIPAHFDPEFLPKELNLKFAFGEYQTKVVKEGTKLVYLRRVKVKGGTYPKETYKDWVAFIKKINANDKQKIVFVNKNG